MRTLWNLLNRSTQGATATSRFDRYYGGVLRPGTGYPTADEARRDLRNYDRSTSPYSWPR